MKKRYLSKEEKLFLIENYSDKGIDYCASILGFDRLKVKKSAQYYGLKLNKYNYISDFYPITSRSAYTMGFLCGDGSFYDNSVRLEINTDDAIELESVFNFTQWRRYIRQRKTWRETTTFHIGSKDLFNWFTERGFKNKSHKFPDISFIPEDYIQLFILGLFDADGSITLKQNKYGHFQISSTYEYDWSPLSVIFESITGVPVSICQQNNTTLNHKYSTMNVYDHNSLIKIYMYLYQSYNDNNIALLRKKRKFEWVLKQFT